MSTLIIIGHVKDGVDLAGSTTCPEPIIDLIEQHHGTTLVEYFYHEALRQQESAGPRPGLADGQPNPGGVVPLSRARSRKTARTAS